MASTVPSPFAAVTPAVRYHPRRPFVVPLPIGVYQIGLRIPYPSPLLARKRSLSSTLCLHGSSFDLSTPPIDHDIPDASEDGIIETFAKDEEALAAADNGVVVADLSYFGRIRVSGADRIQFLHNQSTANFECLKEGQGCDTVFVTATARMIDIAHAWIMKNAITLFVSPQTCGNIVSMLSKYIFFADKVEIQDITEQTRLFVLEGPKANHVMDDLNLNDIVGLPYGTHRHYSVKGLPITVGVGNIISQKGCSLLMSPEAARIVWETLLSRGALPIGPNAWEKLRIFQGRPAPGKELTGEFNVLEAGLWNSISLNKGCYKGQETISRLVTYGGVKRKLWGIRLSAPAEAGSPIIVNGRKVGTLTSYAHGSEGQGHFGLGYVRRKDASNGDTIAVGDGVVGKLVEVPFLAQQLAPSNM